MNDMDFTWTITPPPSLSLSKPPTFSTDIDDLDFLEPAP